MLPREHGAYGQLLFPLATALAISGLQLSALLTATAALAVFAAHEPLVVLLGGRGARVRREQRGHAITWLMASIAIATTAGIGGLMTAPPDVRWLFAWPVNLGLLLIVLLLLDREKSTAGEIIAALTFASVAIPICATTGSAGRGFVVAFSFAGLFVASTLGVRTVILRVRGGGDPGAVRAIRLQLAATIVTIGAVIASLLAFGSGAAPAAVAMLPGVAVATFIGMRPPSALKLRAVGWTLMSTSAFLAAALIAALR